VAQRKVSAMRGADVVPLDTTRKLGGPSTVPVSDIRPARQGKINFDMRPDLLGPNSKESPQLTFVRHGEIENNDKKLTRGWVQAPLTEKGVKQSAEAADKLTDMGITRIESSDLKRAEQTANIIGKKLGVGVDINSGLRPWGMGPKLEGVKAE